MWGAEKHLSMHKKIQTWRGWATTEERNMGFHSCGPRPGIWRCLEQRGWKLDSWRLNQKNRLVFFQSPRLDCMCCMVIFFLRLEWHFYIFHLSILPVFRKLPMGRYLGWKAVHCLAESWPVSLINPYTPRCTRRLILHTIIQYNHTAKVYNFDKLGQTEKGKKKKTFVFHVHYGAADTSVAICVQVYRYM